jgi:hypothetical protein
MLPPAITAAIQRIVDDGMDPATRLACVAALDSAEALQWLVNVYNWDDGYEVPAAIANHPKCDLGTALTLFWLVHGVGWCTGEYTANEHLKADQDFAELLTKRLLAGRYSCGMTSYKIPLGIVKRHQYKKKGIPAVLITDVEGDIPEPFTVP